MYGIFFTFLSDGINTASKQLHTMPSCDKYLQAPSILWDKNDMDRCLVSQQSCYLVTKSVNSLLQHTILIIQKGKKLQREDAVFCQQPTDQPTQQLITQLHGADSSLKSCSSGSQGISIILWKPKLQYHTDNSLPHVSAPEKDQSCLVNGEQGIIIVKANICLNKETTFTSSRR